jgi:hypothetical protein
VQAQDGEDRTMLHLVTRMITETERCWDRQYSKVLESAHEKADRTEGHLLAKM